MRLIFYSMCIGTVGMLIGVILFLMWFYNKIIIYGAMGIWSFIAVLCVMIALFSALIYTLKDIYELNF